MVSERESEKRSGHLQIPKRSERSLSSFMLIFWNPEAQRGIPIDREVPTSLVIAHTTKVSLRNRRLMSMKDGRDPSLRFGIPETNYPITNLLRAIAPARQRVMMLSLSPASETLFKTKGDPRND